VTINLQFDRIPPGVEIGPHRHGVETLVFVASGQIAFEHGEELERRVVVNAGDALYEAPAENHLVRNEGTVDALALLASVEPDARQPGIMLRRWEVDDEPVRRGDAASIIDDGAGVSRRLIVRPGDFGTATFTISEVVLEPGTTRPWHRHPGAEHAIVVFEGRGTVTVDGMTETLEPLIGIRVEAGLAHRIENTGRTPLRFYVCSSPGMDPVEDRELVEAPPRRLDA
jgi:quercetin dioxygenase-like cupin family protein